MIQYYLLTSKRRLAPISFRLWGAVCPQVSETAGVMAGGRAP